MSGFGYRIDHGKAERVEVKAALADTAALVWVHLSTTADTPRPGCATRRSWPSTPSRR